MKRVIVGVMIVLAIVFSVSGVMAQDACEGNFDCDQDVDGTDAAVFKEDFGRSPFSDPCPTCPPPTLLPKTGQTSAYFPGDNGDLETGVEWPSPRFTDNFDGTVTDNLTGLIWLKNASCFDDNAWNGALSDCNGLENGECGLTDGSSAGDWRLPQIVELQSLIDYEEIFPVLPVGHPFTDVYPGLYWSSTTSAGDLGLAWSVSMREGHRNALIKLYGYYVWPVRDPL